MDKLSDIGRKVATAAKTVTKKSEDVVEITRLNLTIGNEEDKIKRLLYEIGSEIYRGYTNGKFIDGISEISDKQCEEVKQIEDNIKSLRERILQLKGSRTCSACNSVVALDVNYCPNCGEKLEKVKEEEIVEETSEVLDPEIEEDEIRL